MDVHMKAVLTVCKFTAADQQTYLMDEEGLVDWDTFTMLESEDFTGIASRAAKRATNPFTIGAMKIKYLKALKFWIEDINRMNEIHDSALFTHDVLKAHVHLLSLQSTRDQVEFTIGPGFN